MADRLLFNALSKTYGFEQVDCAGPVFNSREVKDGGMVLSFNHAESGLFAYEELTGFEIAGADKVFYPATTILLGRKQVFVRSDQVTSPIAERHAWRNWVAGTLYGTNLLPASSFWTVIGRMPGGQINIKKIEIITDN